VQQVKPTVVIPEISVHDLKICIRNQTAALIDVRTPDERAAFNIGGFSLPLAELEAQIPRLDPGRLTVYYCNSGKRSAEAVKKVLDRYPKANVYSLAGGMKAWKEQEGHIYTQGI
jgi:adenylyltransferase/sulfurtransferase